MPDIKIKRYADKENLKKLMKYSKDTFANKSEINEKFYTKEQIDSMLESSNAASATKLQTARTINGTSFNGTANITTANWGTARNISITDGTNTSTAVSVNGSANVSLKLPATIKATFVGNITGNLTGNCSGSSGSCTGNAATATRATQDAAGNTITTTYATKAENNTKANNSEVVHKSGNETIAGTKTFSNGVLLTNVNALMAQNGGYTLVLRNDGDSTYLLISDKDGVPGTWSSARPFVISNSTGVCNINGNASTATNATNANHAKSADTANSATTATTATNATYANWLRTSSHSDHLFHTEWDKAGYFWTYVTTGGGEYRAVRVARSDSSGKADTATKATQDSDGNQINTTYSKNGHTHDDRYYTEAEVNNLLAGKANSSHTHPYIPTSASCNKNWHWQGQGGQPSWLWGGEDGTNMYVYNPSNFRVNYANSAGNGVPAGVIIPFAGTSVPTGYLLCNGAAVSRTNYANLFAAIGTLYGAGNGSTTFNLPDARNRVLQGASGTHSAGSYIAAGLPNITGYLGSSSGFLTANSSSGALQTHWEYTFGVHVDTSQKTNAGYGFSFDASKSNTLYGANSTVQSPAIATNFIIKY